MCNICLDFDRGFMTIPEAVRALSETAQSMGDAHVLEVKNKIKEKAVEEVREIFEKRKLAEKVKNLKPLDPLSD